MWACMKKKQWEKPGKNQESTVQNGNPPVEPISGAIGCGRIAVPATAGAAAVRRHLRGLFSKMGFCNKHGGRTEHLMGI